MEVPKSLYHYTTINTLALILKSQSLNFSRSDRANDKREGASSDFGSFAQYTFITCWTETSEENLALWNMYTPKMRGVRIELPLPIFDIYKINGQHDSIISQTETVNEEKRIFIMPHFDILYKVEYTDDEDLLNPKITTQIGYNESYDLSKIGVYKKKIWAIENEWRFKLNIIPLNNLEKTDNFLDRYSDLLDKRIPPSIHMYFIKIKDSSFRQMKIRLGPKTEPGDYEIINSLINTYNNSATIEFSSLANEIR